MCNCGLPSSHGSVLTQRHLSWSQPMAAADMSATYGSTYPTQPRRHPYKVNKMDCTIEPIVISLTAREHGNAPQLKILCGAPASHLAAWRSGTRCIRAAPLLPISVASTMEVGASTGGKRRGIPKQTVRCLTPFTAPPRSQHPPTAPIHSAEIHHLPSSRILTVSFARPFDLTSPRLAVARKGPRGRRAAKDPSAAAHSGGQ